MTGAERRHSALVAPSTLTLYEVGTVKPLPGLTTWVSVDGGMSDNIRPALYEAWTDIQAVAASAAPAKAWDVVGPVCETADFLGKNREIALQAGSLLAVHGAGAYGFVMSSNYNSRPRAAEVMVDGDRHYLVRERETVADLLRGEHRLPA